MNTQLPQHKVAQTKKLANLADALRNGFALRGALPEHLSMKKYKEAC